MVKGWDVRLQLAVIGVMGASSNPESGFEKIHRGRKYILKGILNNY